MSDLKSGYLLAGVPAAFADRALFKSKLDTYVATLGDCEVIALNDSRRLIREYFGDRVIDSIGPSMSLVEKRRLVQNARWIVLFWDGTAISDFVYLSTFYSKPLKIISVATTRVVNKDRGDEFDVYIGRGTPWGNPFAIGDNGLDRAGAIAQFREYFEKKFVDDKEGNKAILSLRGKVLGCHCKPNLCHGDVIAEYLNGLSG